MRVDDFNTGPLHTETNCAAKAAGICGRLHVGDLVRVGYAEGNAGYNELARVVAQPGASSYTVHFSDGVDLMHEGRVLDTVFELTYSEAELQFISA